MDNNLRVVAGLEFFTSLAQTPGRQWTALRSGSGLHTGHFFPFRMELFSAALSPVPNRWTKVPSENFSLTEIEWIWWFSLRQESACPQSLQLKGVAQSALPTAPSRHNYPGESPSYGFQGFVSFSIKSRSDQNCLFNFIFFSAWGEDSGEWETRKRQSEGCLDQQWFSRISYLVLFWQSP